MYSEKEVQRLAPVFREDLRDLPVKEKMRYLRKVGRVVQMIRHLGPGEFVEVMGHGKSEYLKAAYKWVYPEDKIEVFLVRHEDLRTRYVFRRA
jgi:hypothetical protein